VDASAPPAEAGPDPKDKENSGTPAVASKTGAKPRIQRVHFRPVHDILLLKAVRAQQAHLRGVNGSMVHKWAMVQRDVVSAVKEQLQTPEWTACARTLQERFNKLLSDYRADKLNEVCALPRRLALPGAY
jgi:hypothetical protein